MRTIIFIILLFLLICCDASNKLSDNKFYSEDRGGLLLLNSDSTFEIQNYLSTANSDGSIMGKYKIRPHKKIYIYDLIDRMNLKYKKLPKSSKDYDLIINVPENSVLNYRNVSVYFSTEINREELLGTLENGKNFFSYELPDRNSEITIHFKYNKKGEGPTFYTKYDIAKTQKYIHNKDSIIRIDFDIRYFDLRPIDTDSARCYKLKGDRFLNINR